MYSGVMGVMVFSCDVLGAVTSNEQQDRRLLALSSTIGISKTFITIAIGISRTKSTLGIYRLNYLSILNGLT